jgi:hypothetical protein
MIAIVAFWVATMGWLFQRDLWPRLRPGQPPPYSIDLADEASEQTIVWTLIKDAENKGYANSKVKYNPEDDSFEVIGEFKFWLGQRSGSPNQTVETMYRVTRDGELREIDALGVLQFTGETKLEARIHIHGPVREQQFHPHFAITGLRFYLERTLNPVPVSNRGSILNPLSPLNKIRGLTPGQRWRVPMVDPLSDALRTLAQAAVPGLVPDVPLLEAEVLSEIQELPQLKLRDRPPRRSGDRCLVIQYSGDDISARTWVRQADNVVLRQEVTHHGDHMILDRD